MRVLQVFNTPMHHVLPLARCLAKLVGEENFRYGAVYYPGLSERHQMLGWNCNENDPWILRLENENDREQFDRWWDEADVVLCGERLFSRMKDRLDKGKLTFHMSERLWKPPIGMARLLHPRFALMTARFKRMTSSPYFHFLPIGGYAALDMKRIASFTGRMWNWGYFTSIPDPLTTCDRKEEGFRVLWAGRMLGWKRVDTLIKAFSKLLSERSDAILTIVGIGPKQKMLEELAGRHLKAGSFQVKSAMPAGEIRQLMRQHHVYVLPSGGGEGWGAVINEAMAEGCAVIANEEGGAAKTMIRDHENGLLFAPGDWKGLGDLLCEVGRNEAFRIQLAEQGQRTIVECWSPEVAAERFLSVCEALLANRPVPSFNDGPMSPAWD
jgi:glycosyltransferase involved in cell wall biosynthesis